MDERQSRLLLGMALLLTLLVGVLVFVEPPEADPEPGERVATPLVADLTAADVESIRLEDGDAVIELSRSPAGWEMEVPFVGPADPTRAEGLVASLAQAKASEAIELAEAPSSVGLGAGEGVAVELRTSGGVTHRLVVGDDAPVGGGTYVLDGTGSLRMTSLRIAGSARPELDTLRSREVVRFAASSVTRLVFRGAARSVVLDRDGVDWWVEEVGHAVDGVMAEVPAGRHRADGDRVSEALRAIQDLRIGAFPDAPLDLAVEALRVTIDGEGGPWHLSLGPGADGGPLLAGPLTGGAVPADLSGLDQVLAVPGSAWRSELLLPIRPVTVDVLSVRLGDASLQTQRDGLVWQDGRADEVLNALADARVSRVDAGPAAEGAVWGEISLGEDGAPPATIRLYQAIDGGRVAQDEAGGATFVVRDDAISSLLGALAAP